MTNLITDQRLKMRALGYSPLPLNGKAPQIPSWPNLGDSTDHQIEAWERVRPAETNTGLLTRNNPAFDIDILSNAEVADAVADLIEAELAAIGGRVMVRFGRKPKRAIVCRTDAPFKKIRVEFDSSFTDPETGEIKYDAIEVLGDGQQLACFGKHPDTGQPYEWVGGSPAYAPASDLPLITEADARAIVDKAVAMLAERFSINVRTPVKAARADTPVAKAKTTDAATAWGVAALRSACEMIVNAGSGSQETTLNGQCYGIGQLVGGGELPEGEALDELLGAAEKIPDYDPKNPWDPAKLAEKVKKAFMQGMSSPRAAPEVERLKFTPKHGTDTTLMTDEYDIEIARGTDVAKADFGPEVWAEHGDQLVKYGKEHLRLIHTCDMIYDPLAQFLDAVDAFVSRIEKRPRGDQFAPLYGRTFAGIISIPYSNAPWALRPSEREKVEERQRVTVIARGLLQHLKEWSGLGQHAWPEPRPLPNPLLPVARFDIEFLPECLQRWVSDTAYRMQCPVDFVGVPLINLLGSVIGRKVGIRLKQQDTWAEFANLWGILVARPGKKKSPAMDEVLSFQARLIAQAVEGYEKALEAWRKEFRKYELRREALAAKEKKDARKALEDGTDFDIADSDEKPPVPPSIRRYVTNDATYEKLADLHVANPNGLMVHQDEMIALMRKLGNPDNADWRAFALTRWGGKSSHTVDRIGRGTQTVPHVCLSLFGATQPERIAAYVRPAITGSEDDDGLCQRFQMMVWPEADKPWIYVDEWPDREAKEMVWQVVKWLNSFDPVKDVGALLPDFGSPTPFKRFDHEAQDLWIMWSTKLNNRPYPGRALASHLAKYEKLVGALALIFHLVDCATAHGRVDREKPIRRDQLERAIRFSEYLETHAERVYSSGTFGTVEAARLIRGRIARGYLKDGFSARDIYHPQWSGLTDVALIGEAVEMMVDLSWIRPTPSKKEKGRGTLTYEINPQLGQNTASTDP